MTWAGQSVFALPCGNVGAELFGVTLNAPATTVAIGTPVQIGNLTIDVPVATNRAATILLTGTATLTSLPDRVTFQVSVDGAPLPEACILSVSTGEDPFTVAVSAQTVLSAGSHTIRGVWVTDNGETAAAQQNQLHLEVILGQAAP